MIVDQILQQEIDESNKWLDREQDESVYKRELKKRIELLLNWVLENMKNSDIDICSVIETRMKEIIDKINKTKSIFEADPLHTDLRILDWILFQVCSNEIKKVEEYDIK